MAIASSNSNLIYSALDFKKYINTKRRIGNKICSAEMYCQHPTIGYFHPMQTYYVGELLERVSVPVEDDHEFVWMDYNELVGNMYLEMQSWALEQYIGEIDL